MSTSYYFVNHRIPWGRLWDELPLGLQEAVDHDTSSIRRCLTDGKDYLWSWHIGGHVEFTRYGQNDVANILQILATHFRCRIIDEHGEFAAVPPQGKPVCTCGASQDPGACGHHPDCPLKAIEG